MGTTSPKDSGTGTWIRDTESICPVCLTKIPASIFRYGNEIYMEKHCPQHGHFQVMIWKGLPDYESWNNFKIPSTPINGAGIIEKGCPYDCGLCPNHRQQTCCVLMEVTNGCNLKCPICFAQSGEGESMDPTLEEICSWYDKMLACGGPFNIQLSGGEPSLRKDLDQIIRIGKEKGFPFFQLNTNGIRLAEEKEYAKHLKAAGLSCVFLQFDGTKDSVYEILRGKPLFSIKEKAIENCAGAGIGVVLVPVIVKGINDGEVGNILRYAIDHMPQIRGVHFQPVSFFGRYEIGHNAERFLLPELLQAIEEQTEGVMKISDFKPAGAENAYCSFSGNFIKMEDDGIKAWHNENTCGCGSDNVPIAGEAADRARQFVAKRWSAKEEQKEQCCCSTGKDAMDTSSLDLFLERLDTYTLAVSAMGFMDAWNLDLERLKDCYIHVISQKEKMNLIPFCAYNLTAENGLGLYRKGNLHES